MQLGILLGLLGLMGVVAVFLSFFIGTALNSSDSSTIDELPKNDFNQ
ncbi:hypothetical protein [Lederbergia citrea]|uniref:Uncharacterized protein n=1 Tax=Lederbergia citrea TaxID=2833581 RepID=A0A942Z6L9_9BACI|nr:hypothetical protein [Lederbergia citrea]MBS4179262.1 hypothetical protein [Lederbergia citrea]MBS4205926.1 hypothetical protein [Lederbergia citrea]MBS4224625.1 hypothetical protein [Lederbergia citrea]